MISITVSTYGTRNTCVIRLNQPGHSDLPEHSFITKHSNLFDKIKILIKKKLQPQHLSKEAIEILKINRDLGFQIGKTSVQPLSNQSIVNIDSSPPPNIVLLFFLN